jgi:hypothetical protein
MQRRMVRQLPKQQTVTWAKIDRIETTIVSPNLYKLRPDKGWRWLQRFAIKVLDWIGAHHETTVTTYSRTSEENTSLLQSLLGQEGTWIEYVHHKATPHIYIGPDEHRDLMALAEFRDMNYATFTGRIETRNRYGGKWHNIPITVVPWMKGVLLAPVGEI